MVPEIVGHRLAAVEPRAILAWARSRATITVPVSRETGADRVLGQLGEDLFHRPVEVDLHHRPPMARLVDLGRKRAGFVSSCLEKDPVAVILPAPGGRPNRRREAIGSDAPWRGGARRARRGRSTCAECAPTLERLRQLVDLRLHREIAGRRVRPRARVRQRIE